MGSSRQACVPLHLMDGLSKKQVTLFIQVSRARKAGSRAQLPVDLLPQHSWYRHILPEEGIWPERTKKIYMMNA